MNYLEVLYESIHHVQAVATLIVYDGKVLILKRGHTAPWMPNKWNLPGGVVDPGEDPLQSAIRETFEETGIKVSNLKQLKKVDTDQGWSVTFFYVYFSKWDQSIKLDYENSEYSWVGIDDIGQYQFIPTVKKALIDILNR